MTRTRPSILVAAADRHERTLIEATLRGAGLVAVTVADRSAALKRLAGGDFAAVVSALPASEAARLMHSVRRAGPGLSAVVLGEPAGDIDDLGVKRIERPLDPRQLLGCVFELVLRTAEDEAAPRQNRAAEIGIAAARLACLCNRRALAAADGATRLALDLTRQIGDMRQGRGGLSMVAARC